MIAEEGSINNLLNENNTIQILIDSLSHKSVIVKRNSAEALAFLIKDDYTRDNYVTNDSLL